MTFLVTATIAMLFGVYFFSGLLPIYFIPAFQLIIFFAAATRFSLSFVLGLALWLGLLLDVVSLGPFGLNMLLSIAAAFIIHWLAGSRLSSGSFAGVALILGAAVVVHTLLLFIVASFPLIHQGIIQGMAVAVPLTLSTLIFAWVLHKFVKLEI